MDFSAKLCVHNSHHPFSRILCVTRMKKNEERKPESQVCLHVHLNSSQSRVVYVFSQGVCFPVLEVSVSNIEHLSCLLMLACVTFRALRSCIREAVFFRLNNRLRYNNHDGIWVQGLCCWWNKSQVVHCLIGKRLEMSKWHCFCPKRWMIYG